MRANIFLRADGDSQIGLGHIYRMLALSDILKNHFNCIFLIKIYEPSVLTLLSESGCVVNILSADLNEPESNASLQFPIRQYDILVLDGYNFGTNYQKTIKESIACKMVYIDDIPSFEIVADMIINHCGGIKESDYLAPNGTSCLLGPSYAILRSAFFNLKDEPSLGSHPQNILINFGGSDNQNFTCKILFSLSEEKSFSFVTISVVVGTAFPHFEELKQIVEGKNNINLYFNVSANVLVKIMQGADICICSASTIAYEYCCVQGLLFVLKTAENQSLLYNFLITEKLALPYELYGKNILGNGLFENAFFLRNQQRIFDGLSSERLRKEFKKLYLKNNLVARRAVAEDVDTYFKWTNDPQVRKNSFNSDPVSYSDHCEWFSNSIINSESVLYIYTTRQNDPIASVRFKIANNKAQLSYLVDPDFRNLGIGKLILENTTRLVLVENVSIEYIDGLVKIENTASINAFLAAGYKETPHENKGILCFVFTRSNPDQVSEFQKSIH